MTDAEKNDPVVQGLPRYWVREREVVDRATRVPQLLQKALKLEDPLALLRVFAFWLAGSLLERAEDRTEGDFGPDHPRLADDLLAKLRAVDNDPVFKEGFDLFGAEDPACSLACAFPQTPTKSGS
jgi:hypothetical protein